MKKILMFIILTYTLISCGSVKKEASEHEHEVLPEDIVEMNADQMKAAGIEYGAVEFKNIKTVLRINGLVKATPQNLATVCAPLGGFVKSTDVIAGKAVKKGQVLAMIENADLIELEKNYIDSRSQFEFAEAEYKRHTQLRDDDVYSTKNLQEVTANYKSLKSQMNAGAQKLILAGINPSLLNEDNISGVVPLLAPISGFVENVNVNVGKFVAPTDILFEIVNTNSLMIELVLFEKDIHKIAEGQKLRFSLPNESSREADAVVTHVGKAVAADKTIKAYATFNQSAPGILPGMYVNAMIETANVRVATLPSNAIVQFDAKDFIFIYHQGKTENNKPITEFRMIEVTRGTTDGDFTEVNLPQGFDIPKEKIIVKGTYNLMAAKKNEGEMSC